MAETFASRKDALTSAIDSYGKSEFESFEKEKESTAGLLLTIKDLTPDQIDNELNHLLPMVVDRALWALNNVDDVNSISIVSFFESILRDDFSGNAIFTNSLRNKLFCLIVEKFNYDVRSGLLPVFLEVIEESVITEMFPKIKENKELLIGDKKRKLRYIV